jgi:hypothetical protein
VDEARLAGEEGDAAGEDGEGDELLSVHGTAWKLAFLG